MSCDQRQMRASAVRVTCGEMTRLLAARPRDTAARNGQDSRHELARTGPMRITLCI